MSGDTGRHSGSAAPTETAVRTDPSRPAWQLSDDASPEPEDEISAFFFMLQKLSEMQREYRDTKGADIPSDAYTRATATLYHPGMLTEMVRIYSWCPSLTSAVDSLADAIMDMAVKIATSEDNPTDLQNAPEIVTKGVDNRNVTMDSGKAEGDTTDGIVDIRDRTLALAQTAEIIGTLGLEGVDVQVQIAGLHEIGKRCEKLARDIGMTAVGVNSITQRQLSRLLEVHELTVGRWLKSAAEDQTEHQD